MLSRNKAKQINSLQQKKYREKHDIFVIEGSKLFIEALENNAKLMDVFACDDWLEANMQLIGNQAFSRISRQEMKSISQLQTAPGLLATVRIPRHDIDIQQLKGKLSIALDDIRDPGNMGSIIRAADWFGVETVFCSPETVDAFNPKVVQASMGSIFRVKIIQTELINLCSDLKKQGFNLVAAVMDGENLFETKLDDANSLLIIGNESHGLSDELNNIVNQRITIPAHHIKEKKQSAESLNAAMAASILLAAFRNKK